MIHQPLRFKKLHAAVALVALAVLGVALSMTQDGRSVSTDDGGIPFALAAVPASGQPTYEMFLKMDTIDGSATDDKHRGQIVVDSYAWKLVRPSGAKQAGFNDFVVTMPASNASPNLFFTSAGGLKVARAALGVRRAGGSDDFLKWTLTDIRITSFQTVGNTHGDGVQDQVTLSVGKIEAEYKEPLSNGSFGPLAKKGWDHRTNSLVQY